MANLTPAQVADYVKDLNHQLRKGLITPSEFDEATAFISGTSVRKRPNQLVVEEASSLELGDVVTKFEDHFYQELFGRARDEENDEPLENNVLICRVDGRPAGVMWYAPEPNPAYVGYKYLDMLLVLPEYRGKGIGTRLLLESLTMAPDNLSLAGFAWSPSVEFCAAHGFLRAEQLEEKEGQVFQKIVLPLTPDYLIRHQGEIIDPFDQYAEAVESSGGYPPDFMQRFLDALRNDSDGAFQNLYSNPFTAFLYQKVGLKHRLLVDN